VFCRGGETGRDEQNDSPAPVPPSCTQDPDRATESSAAASLYLWEGSRTVCGQGGGN